MPGRNLTGENEDHPLRCRSGGNQLEPHQRLHSSAATRTGPADVEPADESRGLEAELGDLWQAGQGNVLNRSPSQKLPVVCSRHISPPVHRGTSRYAFEPHGIGKDRPQCGNSGIARKDPVRLCRQPVRRLPVTRGDRALDLGNHPGPGPETYDPFWSSPRPTQAARLCRVRRAEPATCGSAGPAWSGWAGPRSAGSGPVRVSESANS